MQQHISGAHAPSSDLQPKGHSQGRTSMLGLRPAAMCFTRWPVSCPRAAPTVSAGVNAPNACCRISA